MQLNLHANIYMRDARCVRCFSHISTFCVYPALVQHVSVAVAGARGDSAPTAHPADVKHPAAVGHAVAADRCTDVTGTVGPSSRCSRRALDLIFSSLARVPRRTRDAARVGLIARLRRVLACKVVNQRQRVSGIACIKRCVQVYCSTQKRNHMTDDNEWRYR